MAGLKQQLVTTLGQLNKPYGILVRKLDYPYSGSTGELQALAQANAQAGGAARPVSPPLLVYRVYPVRPRRIGARFTLPGSLGTLAARCDGRVAGDRHV